MKTTNKEKQYIYAEVPPVVKRMAIRKAKKADLPIRKWLDKIIREAK